jgi:hypothetical protein
MSLSDFSKHKEILSIFAFLFGLCLRLLCVHVVFAVFVFVVFVFVCTFVLVRGEDHVVYPWCICGVSGCPCECEKGEGRIRGGRKKLIPEVPLTLRTASRSQVREVVCKYNQYGMYHTEGVPVALRRDKIKKANRSLVSSS